MKKWLIKNRIAIVIFALVSFTVVSPQYFIKYPSLIDDGTDVLDARSETVAQILEKSLFIDGRTRPLHLLYRKFRYVAFQTNIPLYYALNAFVIWLIALVVYAIFIELRVTKRTSFFCSLTIFALPSLYANVFRLGTIEHIQALMILSGTLLLLKRRNLMALILFALSCGFKETGIFFLVIPISWFLLSKNKNLKLITLSLLMLIVYVALLGYKLAFWLNSYTEQFRFDFRNVGIVANHNPIFFFCLIVIAVFIYLASKHKLKQQRIGFWLLILTFFLQHHLYFGK